MLRNSVGRESTPMAVMSVVSAVLLFAVCAQTAGAQPAAAEGITSASACRGDNGGITLPPGFCATVFADNIGHPRHLVVAPNGVVYVNTWSGRYYGNTPPHADGFLVALRDTTGDGRADVNVRFGPDAKSGNAGGTGIALYNGALYAETNDRIVRYALPAGTIAPTVPPEVIVSGLPLTGDHPMHPFQIDAHGRCTSIWARPPTPARSRTACRDSPGIEPCTELVMRAGTWRYDANRTGQEFSSAERFATGLRNGEGIAFDSTGRIFATQHGGTSSGRTGPSSIRRSGARTSRQRSWCSSSAAPTTGGLTAIST